MPRKAKRPNEGALRVWHVPQVPCEAFRVDVLSVTEAMGMLDVLARYDAFQFERNIKPDYSSAQGLEVFEDGEWIEWANDDGDDIGDLRRKAK